MLLNLQEILQQILLLFVIGPRRFYDLRR